ncbi:MAG: hypothetical protein CFE43_21065 [Burkholderiales bacterium PBB3]|nr:MAG: hypothetical protein CFE43_21065 [Burkholderiales bacterium PBB3]
MKQALNLKPTPVWLAIFYSATSLAQIASDGSLPGKNKFDKVEINAKSPTDNEMRQRSLVAKRIYGREDIDRFGNINMADVLSNLPGVVIINGAPALSGLDPKYTKILINGDPAPAGWTAEQIDAALVERIEVMRSQTANKSSQAIGGTINIVFKSVPRKAEQTLRVGASYQNERPGPTGTFTTSGKAGDLSYSLPFSFNELLQTYRVNSLRSSLDSNNNFSTGYEEMYWRYNYISPSFSPKFEYTINDDEKLTSQSFFQNITRFLRHRFDRSVLSGVPASESDMDRDTEYKLFRTNLKWTKNLSEANRIEATAAFNRIVEADNLQTSRYAVPDFRRETKVSDTTQTYNIAFTHVANSQHVIATGFDILNKRKETSSLSLYLTQGLNPLASERPFFATSDTKSVYVQDEWEVDNQLALNLGIRAETITLTSEVPFAFAAQLDPFNASSASNQFSIWSPSLFVSYKPDASKKNTLRAGFSRAYKSPDVSDMDLIPIINRNAPDTSKTNNELLSDWTGNPALKPELAVNFDLSYEMYFNQTSSLSVGGFYRDITDITAEVTTLRKVYWATAPRWVSQARNFSHGTSYGMEIEWRAGAADLLPAAYTPANPLNFRLNLNFYGSQIDALPGPNNRLPSQYPWTATLGVDCKPTSNLTLGASAFVSPEFRRQVSDREVFEQSNLDWVNAFAQYKLDTKSTLRLGVNNMFPSTNRYSSFTTAAQSIQNRSGRTGITLTYDTKL